MAAETIPERLRRVARDVRTRPTPLADFIPLLLEAADEIDKWRQLEREAANEVEMVIVMRSRYFTGQPPFVGWKGLGLALTKDYDERDEHKE